MSSLLAYNYQDKILVNILFNSSLDKKTQKSLNHVLLFKHINSLTILDHHIGAYFYHVINMSEKILQKATVNILTSNTNFNNIN